METSISPEKIEAYRMAHFSVRTSNEIFALVINAPSENLKRLFLATNTSTAVFITVFNPFGQIQSENSNLAAHKALEAKVRVLSKHVYDGDGGDPSGMWPKELSYLVLGIDSQTAALLGKEFHQDAVVWSGADAIPRLLLLR